MKSVMENDSMQELPQRSLPRFSIRWMIGLVTVAALFFTVCQSAADGARWAQVTVLTVGIIIATFLAYAAFFLIGMAWDSFLTDRGVRNKTIVPNDVPMNSSDTSGTPIRIVWIVAALFTGSGVAGSGGVASADVNWVGIYPQGANMLDYQLQVGLEKHSGPGGYSQLHLRFNPTRGVFVEEHDLTVTVSSHNNYKTQLSAATSESFTLNQSSNGTTERMLIPHFGAASSLKLWMTENGKVVDRRELSIYLDINQLGYSGQRWTIGIIDRETDDPPFPDVRALTTAFGNTSTSSAPIPEDSEELRLSSKESHVLAEKKQNAFLQFRVMPQTDLATQWLAYSDLDLIMLDAATWTDLINDQPQAAETLQKFVAAGGAMVVYGNDTKMPIAKASMNARSFEKLSSSSILKPNEVTARLSLKNFNDTSQIAERQWNGDFVKISQQTGNSQFRLRQDVYDELTKAGSEMIETMPVDKLASKIEMAEFGLGKVVLIHDEDPFPGSFQLWFALESELTEVSGATPWVERHGIDYNAGNTNYWRWLIESVGGPPVKLFFTLNTLFVLMVGPIAYFALRKLDRLYLLYFGAPAFAALFTGGLFGFAIFSDGVGTKLRTHQWTWVDAANQVVVHQDRSTIYSSFGSDSLQFDRQSLVLPVLPSGVQDFSSYSGTDVPPAGRVRWTDDVQIWSGEFLPTRSQVQYQVTRPEVGVATPVTFEADSDNKNVIAQNHSEGTIGPMVYCDSKSVYHFVDKLEAGKSTVMRVSSQQAVRDLIGARELPPIGFVPNVRSSWSIVFNSNSPGDGRPMPERLLSRWLSRMPKNSFVGLSEVDRSRFPVDDPEVSLATHIIMGRTQ